MREPVASRPALQLRISGKQRMVNRVKYSDKTSKILKKMLVRERMGSSEG